MLPTLYSFRRCPYAIRARMTIAYAGVSVELREVVLKNKPAEMLAISPKGTVPVLQLPGGEVIDESYEVMLWALNQYDPDGWWDDDLAESVVALIEENDFSFKTHLDHYKYADRHPEHPAEVYRSQAESFLQTLEEKLTRHQYLLRDTVSFADVAIFPFIRQFAFVDKVWFGDLPYPKLQQWLSEFLDSEQFISVMKKMTPWQRGDAVTVFPESSGGYSKEIG